MSRYLIVGAGAAGMEAALTLRANDPQSRVTIVTDDPYTHYFRPKLIHFLMEEEPPEELELHDPGWYTANGIEFAAGKRVEDLGLKDRQAVDDQGNVYSWDRLLLACGGIPFVPPVAGAGRGGVFTLRSLNDAVKIREFSVGRKRAAVIGGGLLGLESAFALSSRGLELTVIETAPWLLPRQLDREGGDHLRSLLEAKGLRFILEDQVESIEGAGTEGAAERVSLKSGKRIETDLVLFSVGIRSETSAAVKGGLAVNRGILVDDRLETSFPGVYAAGDAAEHRGVCYGLWPIAKEQGRVAALNMAGIDTVYEGSRPSSQLKITGIDMYSAGDVASLAEEGPGRVIALIDAERYRKLSLDSGGKPQVAMVIGDRAAIQIARRIMTGAAEPEEFRKG